MLGLLAVETHGRIWQELDAMISRRPGRTTLACALRPAGLFLAAFFVLYAHRFCVALVSTEDRCVWPLDWPAELGEARTSCRTIRFMTGTQETVYEIIFYDREQFEALWPVLLRLKTPGAPLRLFRTGSTAPSSLWSNAKPAVRIFGPAEGSVVFVSPHPTDASYDVERLLAEGEALRPVPPWPAEIVSADGSLPEYVRMSVEGGRASWVPGDPHGPIVSFFYRARVDLELVVDGSVIDLNRTQLPANGPVIDRRFEPEP